jgi:hypothetical protein
LKNSESRGFKRTRRCAMSMTKAMAVSTAVGRWVELGGAFWRSRNFTGAP